jgi:hypothetical protein
MGISWTWEYQLRIHKIWWKKRFSIGKKLLNKILQGYNIAQEMKLGCLIQIPKKGDKRKCENYRGISITNPFIKFLGNLIKNWIEKNIIKEMTKWFHQRTINCR